MSKAFTKESDDDNDDELPEIIAEPSKNYVTPLGLELLQQEIKDLLYAERPKIVEVVRWAAGNGDRSENGDYIYGKKRLREIDRRARYLSKRIETAIVVDPSLQKYLTRVFFGATVTYLQQDKEITVKLVGVDEADIEQGKISWNSPVAKALLKAQVDDLVTVQTPDGEEKLEIIEIRYI
ncbi:transcription elongation factor [Legionella beliardensis]|uniref:Transcription elongation factor GreB n=1 Tax=Legionella beliardensis TaxID=91822 RepID=A0A378I3H8_9GAMM|nr:transcription elongation factor GreB [Legionella beliardensis]STX29320.1 transcription elongation factor [Legionella beliardensis]